MTVMQDNKFSGKLYLALIKEQISKVCGLFQGLDINS